jgi:hypothetical protein
MTCFLIEIPVSERDGPGIARVMRMLAAAQLRLSQTRRAVRVLTAGMSAADGRLVCMVEAATVADVRDLVALAFLPAERIREVTAVDLAGWQDPIGDLGSGVQS